MEIPAPDVLHQLAYFASLPCASACAAVTPCLHLDQKPLFAPLLVTSTRNRAGGWMHNPAARPLNMRARSNRIAGALDSAKGGQ